MDLQSVATGDIGGACPAGNGGVIVRVGLDNGDGNGTENDEVLHDDEVDDVAYICNP